MNQQEKTELLKRALPMYINHKVECSYRDYSEDKKRLNSILTGISLNEGVETTYKRKRKGGSGDIIVFEGNNSIHDLEFKLHLHPLSRLAEDHDTLRELAIIADCHFVENLQVDNYMIYQEDGCQVCEVSWIDARNDSFEISWSLEYHEGLDARNGNISLSLGGGKMVHNTNRIFEYLQSNHYDTEMLIPQGLANEITLTVEK